MEEREPIVRLSKTRGPLITVWQKLKEQSDASALDNLGALHDPTGSFQEPRAGLYYTLKSI